MKEFKKKGICLFTSFFDFPLVFVRRIMKLFAVCVLEFVVGREFFMNFYLLYPS